MMKAAIFLLLFCSSQLFASMQNLLIVKKNHNPQNILVLETRTDDACKFIPSAEGPLHFYWLMDGKKRKPVHSMIKLRMKQQIYASNLNEGRDNFELVFKGLKNIKHDLKNVMLHVRAEMQGQQCLVKSILMLGPRHNYYSMDLNEVFCKTTHNLFGVPNGCEYIKLKGTDIASGETIKARFDKK